ncbi:MAG: hypothetical protein K9L74_02525 [Candidatus Izimaplasma sp.]|nr:hypothetical protein [Candidatus Izimaplasma bacterium]
MIKTTDELVAVYKDYSDPLGKIHREIKKGNLIPLKKGIYETDKTIPGHYLSGIIYGPSYLSFEFALSYHGLIPERVYTYTSATYNKNKSKRYKNAFGLYTYRDIPNKAYPYGVKSYIENGYSYIVAIPEKALCDRLYIASPQTSMKNLKSLLFEDLRIEKEDFYNLDLKKVIKLSELYPSSNMKILKKILLKEVKKNDSH